MSMQKQSIIKLLRACAALTVVLSGSACRDGVAPFNPDVIDSGPESPKQLTFSTTPDRNPTWSAGSDTVYYSAAAFFDRPRALNTLVQIARSGGVAKLLAPDIDPASANSLVLPVMSPARDRIAYVRLGFILEDANCDTTPPAFRGLCTGSEPRLRTGTVNIRPLGAINSAPSDLGVPIRFQGVDSLRELGTDVRPFRYNQKNFPFQAAFAQDNDLLFRPTWAPDGKRIVFSDGLVLRIWNTVDTSAAAIPNTTDGVSPAWNGAANRIAFARLVRGDSSLIRCSCTAGPVNIPLPGDSPTFHNRWLYTVARITISVISPDGTGAVDLTDGTEPAWSPDGQFIYYVHDKAIYRIAAAGGTPVLIAGTQSARSPAVSPDGKWLAFAKYTLDSSNSDIWVIRIDQQ